MLFCRLVIFFIINFFEKSSQEYYLSVEQFCILFWPAKLWASVRGFYNLWNMHITLPLIHAHFECPAGTKVCILIRVFIYIQILCMRAAKSLASPQASPQASLLNVTDFLIFLSRRLRLCDQVQSHIDACFNAKRLPHSQ